jgi:hypothetical protein
LGTGWDGTFAEEGHALEALWYHAVDQEVPLFLGEYGIFSEFGNEDDYIREVLSAVEARGGSSAWWAYDPGRGLLTESDEAGWLLPVYAEPWPHRIPGRLEGWSEGVLSLSLTGEGAVEWVAPAGCAGVISGGEITEERWESGRLSIQVEAEGEVRMWLECE